jgi:hypothetical protein
MASELERFPDKVLFQIIKQIAENCESDRVPLEYEFNDEVVTTVIDQTLKIFGVIDSPKYIDDEFLWTVLKMNINKLSEDKLVGSLERPEIKEYEFDIDVNETIYQTTSWTHRIESYGNPYRIASAMEYNGDLDYYSGREGYTDIHDSETNEIRIDKRSFKEI